MGERKQAAFEPGDRVVGTFAESGNADVVGRHGTVIKCCYGSYAIAFDSKIKGGHDCAGDVEDGYGWFMSADALALCEENTEIIPLISFEELMGWD